jgi:hypothetical protein
MLNQGRVKGYIVLLTQKGIILDIMDVSKGQLIEQRLSL